MQTKQKPTEQQRVISNVSQDTHHISNNTIPENSQWSRAIPEAGYITLGTLRYGVRLSNPNLSAQIVGTGSIENSSIKSSVGSTNTVGSSTSNNGNRNKSCCCVSSSGLVLPWSSNSGSCVGRTRLPVPTPPITKNRTSSPSSSSSLQAAASSVSFIRESSPVASACCYSPVKNNLKKSKISYVYAQNNIKNQICGSGLKSCSCCCADSSEVSSENNFSIADDNVKERIRNYDVILLSTAASVAASSPSSDKGNCVISDRTRSTFIDRIAQFEQSTDNFSHSNATLEVTLPHNINNNNNNNNNEKCQRIVSNYNQSSTSNCCFSANRKSSSPINTSACNSNIKFINNNNNNTSGDCEDPQKLILLVNSSSKKNGNVIEKSLVKIKSAESVLIKKRKENVDDNFHRDDENNSENDDSHSDEPKLKIHQHQQNKEKSSRKKPTSSSLSSSVIIKKLTPKLSRRTLLHCSPKSDRKHNALENYESLAYIDSSGDVSVRSDCDDDFSILRSTPFKYKKISLDTCGPKDNEYFNLSENSVPLFSNTSNAYQENHHQPSQQSDRIKEIEDDEVNLLSDQKQKNKNLNCFRNNQTCAKTSAEQITNESEKKRIKMDRLQKLGFGRRSQSNLNETKSGNEKSGKRSSDKTERLRELTELLRSSVTRGGVNAPVPPPRRPRLSHSVDKTINEFPSTSDSLEEEPEQGVMTDTTPSPRNSLYKSLRPISSVSNLENLMSSRNSSKKNPPIAEKEDDFPTMSRTDSKLSLGQTQKSIPFRSASFSQVDYSSGKYIRSALGALKAAFSKEKEISVVDSANLTLPRNKHNRRSVSPKKDEEAPVYVTDRNSKEILSHELGDEDVILEEKPISPIEFDDGNIAEVPSAEEIMNETNMAQTSEITLETLTEEDIPHESLSEEPYLQTATTCLIPVPVYECVVREWCAANSSDEWIDAKEDEVPKLIEEMGVSLDMIQEINECDIAPDQLRDAGNGIERMESMDTNPSIGEEARENDEEQSPVTEFVEVRKRHSNNADNIVAQNSSTDSQSSITALSGDEKRRIDKSRRRKGIYIKWPAASKTTYDGDSDPLTDDNLTPEETKIVAWSGDCEILPINVIFDKNENLNLSSTSEFPALKPHNVGEKILHKKAVSECSSIEPQTPEYEMSQPTFGLLARRKSLTCQSSEEKDESLSGSPMIRHNKSLQFLRQDSMSDNESDRTPPRERSSASPAPYGEDLRRYSKRPLRGPYGQMLEAEMKKPGKLVYDELLEELNPQENSLSPPVYIREKSVGSHSFDDTASVHKSKHAPPGHLPVPCHIRAASTPSNIDLIPSSDQLLAHQKRFPSSIEPFTKESERRMNDKKLSLDSCSDKILKRSSQGDLSKRNSSGSENQKMIFDDNHRLSTSSRTPSERSILTLNTPETTKSNILPTPELLAQLLKGSSERGATEHRQMSLPLSATSASSATSCLSAALPTAVLQCLDTRTHVVVELYNTEQSYVESLQTVIVKYFNPLKSPENSGIVDVQIVDEIFFKVPAILSLHEKFLDELRRRLDSWDSQQRIGDAFVEVFSKPSVLDTYTSFVNNWNRAKDAIRTTSTNRPQFARFLEAMTREHKRKLSLDNLLIKPVQKFPNYELIFQRLIKHTDVDHPDQKPLQDALKLVHGILVHLNCKEREAIENVQRESTLRELEGVIEGISDLIGMDRSFLLFDLVTMPSGQATRKERGFFLFSDLLVITSIKRRSGTIRKQTNLTCPGSVAQTLDTNKYKFLTKIPLDGLEIVKAKDENLRKLLKEIDNLTEDCNKLTQIADLASSLKHPHQLLEETIRDYHRDVQRQLSERQLNDPQFSLLELTINSGTRNGSQNLSVVFSKPEKRNQWEELILEAKQKLAASMERYPIPEFVNSIPIRKTRAGLQFTCAAPTLGPQRDVWVCNSDGYVGQVCVMSLEPEPTVTSCNGVCNARIMCIASVPTNDMESNHGHGVSISIEDTTHFMQNQNSITTTTCPNVVSEKLKSNSSFQKNNDSSDIQLDSGSSSDDSETENQQQDQRSERSVSTGQQSQHSRQESNPEESDTPQPTMWLGTEDGCIHIYNCNDNIRTKKNKIKIQHITAVYSILYLDNRVFVSLANGDICVYLRDQLGGWNVSTPLNISIGTVSSPVTKLLNAQGKLWCAIQGIIKVLNIQTLQVENQIQISTDSKPITNMTVSNNFVWISIQNSARIKCFHSTTYELLSEVDLAQSVYKMLSNCDDIIRQHKAACLRVTSLLACKDLIWVGTSAGVLLTVSQQNNSKSPLYSPAVTGIPHGHTGHVRFLTFVDNEKSDESQAAVKNTATNRHSTHSKQKEQSKLLIISGGDGYEDFRGSGTTILSEVAGREDSTNHLLLWHV